MQFRQSESKLKPAEVEEISSGRYLLRKNIKEVERTNTDGETITIWTYDEAVASAVEYSANAAVLAVESRREAEIVDEHTLQLIEEGVL